ncbi:PEP-CTERM sorting domain-containing protein [Rheinheimera baltica]|uniref:PEP-CTERM sorting domain-containing protein n=1 Tax=Rheinheimera baltica TaxID=67576 RepID=UPI00273F3010|nr:PEP-CTERM sorting domain-containing protein [Rheinheimera baltica]MDP5141169.1 PEP-CTERM sorting domain-containing protein [Rheinheimera baltica]MDP5148399.1 PEP-CTERM sorting domain-containing protein [Rheinheimera baltica]
MKSMLFALCLLFTGASHAALIQLNADRSDYQVGDIITVTLSMSDLTETMGGFWAEVLYPTSAVSLLNWQFGSGFDDGFGSYQFDEHNALVGALFLSDYADLFADEMILATQQGRSFELATFSFLAGQVGDVLISLNFMNFGAVNFANDFVDVSATDLNLTITAAQVPAPASALLMLAGLGLLYRRRYGK